VQRTSWWKKINSSSDPTEHVEEASRQKSMQQQVIIQLGDPTLLKASKSLLPSIQITVGSFGTCLYAENINQIQGSNLSLPPQ